MLGNIDMEEIYRVAAGPVAYSIVLVAIATLCVREAVGAAGPEGRSRSLGPLTFVLVIAAFIVLGVRLADLAR